MDYRWCLVVAVMKKTRSGERRVGRRRGVRGVRTDGNEARKRESGRKSKDKGGKIGQKDSHPSLENVCGGVCECNNGENEKRKKGKGEGEREREWREHERS